MKFPAVLLKQQYEMRSKSAGAWILAARRLKAAADVVMWRYRKAIKNVLKGRDIKRIKYLELLLVYPLLSGLAIENLAKAIRITQTQGEPAPPPMHHQTTCLLRDAKVGVSATERALLRRLEMAVVWSGRYPVPKKPEQMAVYAFSTSDVQAVNDLYARLERIALGKGNP